MSFVISILILGFIIFIHEFGHFIFAIILCVIVLIVSLYSFVQIRSPSSVGIIHGKGNNTSSKTVGVSRTHILSVSIPRHENMKR